MKKKEHMPIMSIEDERFMAFTGLIQWTQGVVLQSKRVTLATEQITKHMAEPATDANYFTLQNQFLNLLHCEEHYFIISANKLIEHREWIKELGLFKNVDFSEIDSFPTQNIKDLRDMREHIVHYFKGDGKVKERWVIKAPNYSADASSRIDNMLGGRLDYIKFVDAAERLLPRLLKELIPYPPNRL